MLLHVLWNLPHLDFRLLPKELLLGGVVWFVILRFVEFGLCEIRRVAEYSASLGCEPEGDHKRRYSGEM
jgi:hypothetical protein